jgi:hypothetical protein
MCRSRSRLVRLAALVVFGCLMIAGCSSDPKSAPKHPAPTVFTAKDASCNHDQTSSKAKDTIERVGGLVTDDYVVRFSESTRLGVVALVDGDTKKAFDDLADTYGVVLVAQIEDDHTSKVTGFQQVRDLVAAACD